MSALKVRPIRAASKGLHAQMRLCMQCMVQVCIFRKGVEVAAKCHGLYTSCWAHTRHSHANNPNPSSRRRDATSNGRGKRQLSAKNSAQLLRLKSTRCAC